MKKKISLRQLDGFKARIAGLKLHTICTEALCPNISECFSRGQATFLILGRVCTRNCAFCNVSWGNPDPPDWDEPNRLVQAAERLSLRHVVITSPTRDDLTDGGAGMFVAVIKALRKNDPSRTIEVLIPDFGGRKKDIWQVVDCRPEIIGHNLETVRRLYPLRNRFSKTGFRADYDRSLEVLNLIGLRDNSRRIKSALMLGLGETGEEVKETIRDIYQVGCRYLSIGQYLRPTRFHLPVIKKLRPEEFSFYHDYACSLGFNHVESGEFVRSSYHGSAYLD